MSRPQRVETDNRNMCVDMMCKTNNGIAQIQALCRAGLYGRRQELVFYLNILYSCYLCSRRGLDYKYHLSVSIHFVL